MGATGCGKLRGLEGMLLHPLREVLRLSQGICSQEQEPSCDYSMKGNITRSDRRLLKSSGDGLVGDLFGLLCLAIKPD